MWNAGSAVSGTSVLTKEPQHLVLVAYQYEEQVFNIVKKIYNCILEYLYECIYLFFIETFRKLQTPNFPFSSLKQMLTIQD